VKFYGTDFRENISLLTTTVEDLPCRVLPKLVKK